MRKALEDIVLKSCEIARPKNGDIVVDIGCNDGTLLRSYKIPGLRLVGFEPAKNLVEEARKGTEFVFNDFFGHELFRQKFPGSKAKLLTSIAMFYDLDDPDPFVADIVKCLDPQGVWVIQQNYLCSMLEQNGFDNIGHEHLTYYSLGTMGRLLSNHDLEIFDVEKNDVNGGSFRTYVARKGQFPVQESVEEMKEFERKLFAIKPSIYSTFAKNIRRIRAQLSQFISSQVGDGKTVYVYGACYDTETRAVTTDGFKTFDQLKDDDRIITLNPRTKEIETQTVQEIIIQPYKGPMICFRGKRVDLCVTPDHNMLVETWHSGKLAYEKAHKTRTRSCFKLPRGKWRGIQNETFQITRFVDKSSFRLRARKISDEIPTVDFLYLLGLYIGDGYCDTHSQGFIVNYCVPEGDKARQSLKATLERNSILYREESRGREIHVSSKALVRIFSECGRGAHEKRIPEWALKYAPNELSFLLKGLIDSDGWQEKGPEGRMRYVTVSEHLVHGLVQLGFKLGFYPTVSRRESKSTFRDEHTTSTISYIVNMARTRPVVYNRKQDGTPNLTEKEYDGIIWCATVPNHNFLVERNGKFAFCGNSTRGNTILQYCGLDNRLIKKATDANPEKWGLRIPGTGIPIVSKVEARHDNPDYFLVLPHHFLEEIRREEREYLHSGGKFIVPLPQFRLVGS